jgi:hypothetical protein
MEIVRPAQPNQPFTVVGERGGIFGQQDGTFELWDFPVKVLRNFHITAELADYPVPIDLNQQAAVVQVEPDLTTITYAHAAITVKQHMFAVRGPDAAAGVVVLFEIHAVRPADITFSFDPVLQREWPAPNFGRPSASWNDFDGIGGYLLSTDNPKFFAALVMPGAQPGILPPYQEKPKYFPLQFKLHFDPKTESNFYFPLFAVVSDGSQPEGPAAIAALGKRVAQFYSGIAQAYQMTENYYSHFFDDKLTVSTPDPQFDNALRWAEISIDQMQVKHGSGKGLAAGWFSSGDSARPGFGWFFGRDTLWSLYAIDSYGDFGLARNALEFLMNRQRADGKMMHEYAQTADLVDWSALPYEYASADATPLFLMAMDDYVQASGDVTFLRQHWDNVRRAYAFMRGHDSDSDGIYDNSAGTGWVESWPPGMPHQEMYLASLDEQAENALAHMVRLLGDRSLAQEAEQQASLVRSKLPEYLKDGFYAFSRNANGSFDTTATIFPSVAWWSGTLKLPGSDKMFERWASDEFSTDWGTRSVSDGSKIYDPISYHQGSVWPLFTGWVSLAEYRAGHSLSAYAHLMQNLDLTWAQDQGAVTELLSGRFFQPLGRSTAHQMWSSAMVISPSVRGLFGIEADVPNHVLRVSPQIPAAWDGASLHNVPFGPNHLDVDIVRKGTNLVVTVHSQIPIPLCLVTGGTSTAKCEAKPSGTQVANIPLPELEVGISPRLPLAGSETTEMKVLDQRYSSRSLAITLEAPASSTQHLNLRINNARLKKVTVEGGERKGDHLVVQFPAGSGYVQRVVTLSWR